MNGTSGTHGTNGTRGTAGGARFLRWSGAGGCASVLFSKKLVQTCSGVPQLCCRLSTQVHCAFKPAPRRKTPARRLDKSFVKQHTRRNWMPEWRNGRRSGLKIRFRKECGFDSRFGQFEDGWVRDGRDGARPSRLRARKAFWGEGGGGGRGAERFAAGRPG